MNTEKIKTLLFDVRLWIGVLFLIRLANIDLPPYDVHSFRQCGALGVARCYMEVDWNLFAPRTIMCDSRPGFEVMEFPVLNYAIFLMWKIFGEHNWCFRSLGITVASLGLWHFYRIIRRITGERAALAGTVLFGASIAFIYARKAMPDVFSLSLVLTGVSLGWDYLEKGKNWRLGAFTAVTALGLLSKIPSAVAVTLLVWPMFDRNIAWRRKGLLASGGIIAVAAMSVWYFVWIPWAEKEYQHGWFFRLGWEKAWHELFVEAWGYTKERFDNIAMQNRAGFWICLFGIFGAVWERNWRLLGFLVLYSAVFLVFMLQVGKIFSGHEYYVIPYIPVMALLAGYALNHLLRNEWLFFLALTALATDSVYRMKDDFFIPWKDRKLLKLESIADRTIPPREKILVIGDLQPAMMYAAHRRGWANGDLSLATNPKWLDGEATVGLHSAIVDRAIWADSLPYPMLFEDNDFRIFKIKKD